MNSRALAIVASTAMYVAAAVPAHAALDDATAQELSKKSGCTKCHKLDKHATAPSFQDIAAKRKSESDAIAVMTKAVRSGSTGTYGKKEMDAIPAEKISDPDLLDLLQWTLTK